MTVKGQKNDEGGIDARKFSDSYLYLAFNSVTGVSLNFTFDFFHLAFKDKF